MAVQTPGTDPLYAWDVPAWTNQKMGASATAGTNLDSSSGPGTGTFGASAAGISGYQACTQDPATAVTAAASVATGVLYGSLVYFPDPSVVSKFYILLSTTGSVDTHAFTGIWTTAGALVVASADQTTTPAAGNLSASTTLAPGYYYLATGVSFTGTNPVYDGVTALGVTIGNGAGAVYATTGPFPRFVATSGVVISSGTAPASVTWAAQSSLGSPFIAVY